jgi:hypothetical protein
MRRAAVAIFAACLWPLLIVVVCLSWRCEWARLEHREEARERLAESMSLIRGGAGLRGDEAEWIRAMAVWPEEDIDFFRRYFVVPTGRGRFFWIAGRPMGWSEYCTLMAEVALTGATYEGLALSRNGVEGFKDSNWAESVMPGKASCFERALLSEQGNAEVIPILERLVLSDFEGARQILHSVGLPGVRMSGTARNGFARRYP